MNCQFFIPSISVYLPCYVLCLQFASFYPLHEQKVPLCFLIKSDVIRSHKRQITDK